MKTLPEWFKEYGESHRNKKNKLIHIICVPAIFLSIIGLLWTVSITIHTFTINLAVLVPLVIWSFYWPLSKTMAFALLIFTVWCLLICSIVSQSQISLFWSSITLFVLAWIGQFLGHKIEGVKPSFFKDVQFLLIGPAWVLAPLLEQLHIKY